MDPINIADIEQDARHLRAQEMQRMHGLVSAYLSVYSQLLGTTLLSGLVAIGDTVRHWLSRNPKAHHPG